MPSTRDRGSWKALSLIPLLLLMLQVRLSCSTTSCHIQVDMAVVVDTSSSCAQAEFSQLLSQVKALVSGFQVGPGKTRLALIGMSQSAQVLANFNDVGSLSDFDSAVHRLKLTSDQTEISKGMKLARESVLITARGAPVPRLVVLVKDRRCSDRAMGSGEAELALIKSEAAAVRSMGGTVHAVGIGGLWNSQNKNALFGSNYVLFKNRNKAMESIKSLNSKVCTKLGTCFGNRSYVLTANVAGAVNSAGARVSRQEISRSFQSCSEKQSCNKNERTFGACQADGTLVIVDRLQYFSRKTHSCVTDEEKHKVDCSRARVCESQVADVIIMLDRSIAFKNKYHTLVDAAVELVKSLRIGEKHVHLGVVSFSGYRKRYTADRTIYDIVETIVELGEEFNKLEIENKVSAMKNNTAEFQGAFTGEALEIVDATLRSKGRRDVFKAVILITDGQSNHPLVTVQSISNLKNNGVTIYAIGVKPTNFGRLKPNVLKMMTAPESDKNLFILENFDQFKPWARNFSTTLCLDLKPPNPKLCDADVQLRSVSVCVLYDLQVTSVEFKYDAARKCIKHFNNTIIKRCNDVCVDPVNGNDHMEGESWANLCYNFRCTIRNWWESGELELVGTNSKCLAADFSCKAIGSAPFQCRNIDGEVRENCQCVEKRGEAVLVVDNPN